MNFVWLLVLTCLASAGLAAGSTSAEKDLKKRSSSVDGPFAPRTLPDNYLFAPTTAAAADPTPEMDHDHKDEHVFKDDIAEMESGHYPVGFVDGKARLTNYAPKLEFYGIFINDEIVFALDNFEVAMFSESAGAKSLLKLKMGDEVVQLQFFNNGDKIQTDMKIGNRESVLAHATLKSGQKLRIHLKKNEIKIDGQELGKDLSITGALPIVKTSKGNDAMKVTIDSSGMRDAAFDLQLETPFAESTTKVGTAGWLQTWHFGLMGAIVVGVIVAGLLVCSLCKKCPLHKKMCSKDKEPVVKATETTKAGEKPTQPEEKNEKNMEKITVAERLSVTRAKQTDAAPKKDDPPQTQPNTSARDGTKSISYKPNACKNDDGGYDGLDPNEGQEKQSKKSQKGKDAKVVLKDGMLPGKKPSGQKVDEKKVSEEVKKPAEKASNEKGVDPTQEASQESKALGIKPKNSKNTTATLSIDASGTDGESVSGQEPKGAAEKASSKSGKKKAESTKEKSGKKLKKGNTQPTQVSTASVDATQSNVTVDKTQDK